MMMHRIDIEEQGNKYVVTFEMPSIREENIIIGTEGKSLQVIALNKTVTADMQDKSMNLDIKSIIYDKTAVLDNPDFSKLRFTFFAGWLEVIVPMKTGGNGENE